MKNASRIALFGSPKQPLQSVPIDLLQLCLTNNIQIEAQSIPRDANQKADIMSRFVDKDDWSLNSEVFSQLDKDWGPTTVDRFASIITHKCGNLTCDFCHLVAMQLTRCPKTGEARITGFAACFHGCGCDKARRVLFGSWHSCIARVAVCFFFLAVTKA